MTIVTPTSTQTPHVSSAYRVKFRRQQFLELIEIAQPPIIYHVKRMHFFSYQGFVMYSLDSAETVSKNLFKSIIKTP